MLILSIVVIPSAGVELSLRATLVCVLVKKWCKLVTSSFRARMIIFDNFGNKKTCKQILWPTDRCLQHVTLKPQVILRLSDERFLLQRRAAWKWRMGGLWDLGQTKRWSLQQHDATSNVKRPG